MLFTTTQPNATPNAAFGAREGDIESFTALKVRIHQRLLDILNLGLLDKTPREALRVEIRGAVNQLLAEEKRLFTPAQTDQLIEDVLDELLGLGPLEPLLKDETVSDILINTHKRVFIERRGVIEETAIRFRDEAHLLRIINNIWILENGK